MNRKTVKKMAEQRLIDANIMAEDESEAYISAQTSGKISPITQGLNSVVHRKIQQLIADTPTIDPESLPVVRKLRKELARVTAERDAAVEQLRGYCPACKNYTENHCEGPCEDCKHEYYQYRSKKAMDNWEWRGPKKEE